MHRLQFPMHLMQQYGIRHRVTRALHICALSHKAIYGFIILYANKRNNFIDAWLSYCISLFILIYSNFLLEFSQDVDFGMIRMLTSKTMKYPAKTKDKAVNKARTLTLYLTIVATFEKY